MTSEDPPEPGAAKPLSTTDKSAGPVLVIATAVGITTMSYNLWFPFLPLYVLDLGATSDANALFWMSVALAVQGGSRLASSAIWGVLSDRLGRKMMLVRALVLGSLTFLFAAIASEPWHLAVALGCQGLFAGFIPASAALVSVLSPDAMLNRNLNKVTGVQYLGTTTGPTLGALLALVLSYRETILLASLFPLLTAFLVLFKVPRDQVTTRPMKDGKPAVLEPFTMSGQFKIAVAGLFLMYCMTELLRLSTPIALKAIKGSEDVAGEAGLAFSISGLASAISVLFVAPRLFKGRPSGKQLAGVCVVGAVGFLLAGLAGAVPVYILGVLCAFIAFSTMIPAMNTLIAANVLRSRRGTAFGVAASFQAMAFGVGPACAAIFAAISLEGGFFSIACLFLAFGFVLFSFVRPPEIRDELIDEPIVIEATVRPDRVSS